MNNILEKYGKLLVEYALYLKKGERVYVVSTDLATPLLKEFYKEALKVGAYVYFNTSFEDQDEIFFEYASEEQLRAISLLKKRLLKNLMLICILLLHIKQVLKIPSIWQKKELLWRQISL